MLWDAVIFEIALLSHTSWFLVARHFAPCCGTAAVHANLCDALVNALTTLFACPLIHVQVDGHHDSDGAHRRYHALVQGQAAVIAPR